MDVSVCICTYRRPRVIDTIVSVLAQSAIDGLDVEIIVCDDDPHQSARESVERTRVGARVPVRYIVSGARNVATARNACLAAAQGKWVAFIDDDEEADAHWLSELLAAQAASGAEIVKGFVRAEYPHGTPPHVLAGDPYTRNYGPTGTPLRTAASGNVLLDRAHAIENDIWFAERFGRSGGEDTDFFRRYSACGGRMVASQNAIVTEIVLPERVTFEYLRRRYLRLGQTNGRQLSAMAASEGALALVVSAVCCAMLWTYPATKRLGNRVYFRCFSKYWYSRGMLEGACGYGREEMV